MLDICNRPLESINFRNKPCQVVLMGQTLDSQKEKKVPDSMDKKKVFAAAFERCMAVSKQHLP